MKKYVIVINGTEFVYNSKKEADNAFIDAFLNGDSVYEIKK